MRLLIDLQACQSTSSRARGIGRYSIELAKAMVRQNQGHDIHLLLNAAFTDSILDIRQIFADQIPSTNIHLWYGVLPCNELNTANTGRLRSNEYIREQAIREINPDIVHVSSLFEGLSDDAVVSVPPTINSGIPTAVTLYDLIPLINAKVYLANQQVRAWYYRKVQSLKRAQLLMAISESSRQEAINYLSMPEENVVNISSAVDDRFSVQTFAEDEIKQLLDRYGLRPGFVMYTGGIDLRKNIEGLIEAFARLPLELRKSHQLAIVCSVQAQDRERLFALAAQLGMHSEELVLTGFVPDPELPKLYHACKLFVFPSWHEGFGLPALEAMSCGAPVIAANTSSLPEVVGWSEALFDPHDIDAIKVKMQSALEDDVFRKALVAYGLQQAQKFSWDASARTALKALSECVEAHRKQQVTLASVRQKLAYVSPVPPAQSGIADYSGELLRELAVHYDIEIITDQDEVSDPWILANFPVRKADWFAQHGDRFQRTLYHFGNSMFHEYMLDLMESHSGVVVLHDFYLSGLIAHLDLTGQRKGIWNKSLFQSHGYAALFHKAKTEELNPIIWQYPCNQHVLERALGLIVHSKHSASLASAWYGEGASALWETIPLLRKLPPKIDRQQARQELGLADDEFLICSFGILGPTKLNQALLDAWLMSPLANNPKCKLVFVGKQDEGAYGATMQATIADAHLEDRVLITGFADVDLFHRYLGAADVAVQLRGISRGETSAAVLDCLAYGIPTIINKSGAMAELPDGPLMRLDEHFELVRLGELLYQLWESTELRAKYSEAARDYVHHYHRPGRIASAYKDAIERFYELGAPASLRQTIRSIAELDVEFDEADVIAIASALDKNRYMRYRKRLLFSLPEVLPSDAEVVCRKLAESLLLSLPQHVCFVPIKSREQQLHVAAKDFEDFLCIPTGSDLDFDLEPLSLTPMDVVLSIEVNQDSHTDSFPELVKVCGAQRLILNIDDIRHRYDQVLDRVLEECRS